MSESEEPVKRLVVIVPHEDDETLSMWPAMHYLACDYETHFVFLTRGEVTATSLRLDGGVGGTQICQSPRHPFVHNHVQEQFELPTVEQIGLARLHEGMSAVGAMAMVRPMIAGQSGAVFCHDENLGTAYGSSGSGSSTAPWTEEGVAKADAVIRKYIEQYPNTLFWSMSPTDAHPDHAASGVALRRLKGTPHLSTSDPNYVAPDPVYGAALVNAKFWVSKLYWSTPLGTHGSRLGEQCAWWPNNYPNNYSDASLNFTRRAEYTAWIKAQVMAAYTAWDPAAGSFAIGAEHSTPSQFSNCFGQPPPFVASALWHN